MRVFLAASLVIAALPAHGESARALLERVAKTARGAHAFRASGLFAMEGVSEGVRKRTETRFRLAMQGPLLLRWEADGADPMLLLCDGATYYSFAPGHDSYRRAPATTTDCRPPIPTWESLAVGLVKAEYGTSESSCQVVEADYEIKAVLSPAMPMAGRLHRSLCIDPERAILVHEQIGAVLMPYSIRYDEAEWNPTLDAATFRFAVPDGVRMDAPSATVEASGAFRAGSGVSAPSLLRRTTPKYTARARKAHIQGTVLLYVEVWPDGIAHNIRVLHSLDPDLDRNAIQTVQQWRFRPGEKDGKPVKVSAQIEVNFRLL